jgi:hypothetical protein
MLHRASDLMRGISCLSERTVSFLHFRGTLSMLHIFNLKYWN